MKTPSRSVVVPIGSSGLTLPTQTLSEMALQVAKLKALLGELGDGAVVPHEVALLFVELHRSGVWENAALSGHEAWAAFVRAEGLRVEDLDSQLGDDAVRAFACALACAGLTQRAVAVVVSRAQPTVFRYLRAVGCPGPRKSGTSPADFAESVLAGLMAWADTEPLVPKDALLQAVEQLEAVPGFVAECEAGLALGAPVDSSFDRLLHCLHRELEKVSGSLQSLGQARGIRL